MAASTSFKQQCPSCEAMVPIRDPNLIGKKIDCPKCKYRFVVEDPGDTGDAEDEAPKKKKRRDEDDADGKAKGKGGPKRRRTDEDDEDGKGAGKKEGSNKVVLVVGIAVVALAALGGGAWFLFFNDDGGSNKSSSSPAASSSPAPSSPSTPTEGDTAKTEPAAAPAATASPTEFLTNMLPPDTEGLINVRMQEFLKTPVGRMVVDAPGAFRADTLSQRLGLNVADVDGVVQGWNFTHNWTFTVVHLNKPVAFDNLRTVLAKPTAEPKIEDQEYYLLKPNPWLETMGRLVTAAALQIEPARVPERKTPLAVFKKDDQTLVFADVEPMKAFLQVKGTFPSKSQAAPPPEAKKEGEGDASKGEGGGPGGGSPGGGMMPDPARMAAMRGAQMGQGGGPGGGKMGGMMAGGPPGAGGEGEAKPAEEATPASGAYLTINPPLKSMLDKLEVKSPSVSLALDNNAAKSKIQPLTLNSLGLKTFADGAGILGAALIYKDGLQLTLAADGPNEVAARKRLKEWQNKKGEDEIKALGKTFKTTFAWAEDTFKIDLDLNDTSGAPPTGFGGGAGGPGGMMPGMMAPPSQGPMAMGGAGGPTGSPDGIPGGPGRGMMSQGGAGGPGGRMQGMMPGMMPGFGQDPNAAPAKPKVKPGGTLKLEMKEKTTVVATIALLESDPNDIALNTFIRPEILKEKGYVDMASGRLRVFDLAGAVPRMVEKNNKSFPRGTAQRDIPSTRAGRPYPPNDRVSWMAELLPYLGGEQASLYSRIDKQKSWREGENAVLASTLVPQFLDPHYSPTTWWVKYPGLKAEVAGTHFVGLAGVGLDAADYTADDPSKEKLRGIFGYDRATSLQDLTDGASNTILMVQAPPTFKRPWMAGGGSTVVGVPESNSAQPFITTTQDGKKGTLAVMADGSVRFISDKVQDDVFKALVTTKGGETVILNSVSKKLDPPDDEAELKTDVSPIPAAPTTPPTATPASPTTASAGWEQFKGPDFVVSMPGKPVPQSMNMKTPAGDMKAEIWGVNNGGAIYAVAKADAKVPPFDLNELDKDPSNIKGVMAALGSVMGGQVKSLKKITVGDLLGLELEVDSPSRGILRARLFYGKDKVYSATTGPAGKVSDEDMKRFLESFKVNK